MIRSGHVVASALLLLPAASCSKEAASAGGGAARPTELRAELAAKPMAKLYGVAQPNPGEGNSHRLTFSTRPITCANMTSVLDGAAPGETFIIRAHEALRPDGTTAWAYGGVAAGGGGSAPAGMVAMGAYQVEAGHVVGTLPAGVTTEEGPGSLVVSGSFTVPLCEALPMPKLRDLADVRKMAAPIEATGSTARMSVAGKAFDVKGATAVAGRDGRWMVRLTALPHGCVGDIEVPGDLVVVLELGGEAPELYLRGNWIAGSSDAAPLGGTLKADLKAGAAAVEVTLSGAMDYAPADAPYKVELSGTVNATVCAAG